MRCESTADGRQLFMWQVCSWVLRCGRPMQRYSLACSFVANCSKLSILRFLTCFVVFHMFFLCFVVFTACDHMNGVVVACLIVLSFVFVGLSAFAANRSPGVFASNF